MKLLEDRILRDGQVRPGNVLKVDCFLNHQLDVDLLDKIGEEFYRIFKDDGVNKILTIEASGIAIACMTARHFDVPVVFAKKAKSKNIDGDVYTSTVHSYTYGKDYNITLAQKFLGPNDRVLILDDFLANGKAMRGLLDVCQQAGASVYPQVKWMHENGIDVDVIVGSKTKDMLILEKEMETVAGNLYVTTDDGSYGRSGMVTTVIEDLVKDGNTYDVCVAIGPMIMMKFVCLLTKKLEIPTIVSMNPIMVDGTGMCGACRLTVGDEVKFACVDGPEFDGHLVDFDQAMKRQQMYKTEEGRAMLKLQEGDTHHGGCGHCGGDK